MKNFILIIALLFTVGSQVQAKELTPVHYETITYSIDAPDVAIVQDAHITIAIGENHNHKGQHVHHATNSRHAASLASSRYSQNKYTYKQAIGSSTYYQIQSSIIIYKESWKRNSSRMYMRGAPASGETLQGNDYNTKTNYNRPKANYCTDYQPTQLFAKSVFLDRDSLRRTSNCIYWREIYKTLG